MTTGRINQVSSESSGLQRLQPAVKKRKLSITYFYLASRNFHPEAQLTELSAARRSIKDYSLSRVSSLRHKIAQAY
jgi:hypothetical protein